MRPDLWGHYQRFRSSEELSGLPWFAKSGAAEHLPAESVAGEAGALRLLSPLLEELVATLDGVVVEALPPKCPLSRQCQSCLKKSALLSEAPSTSTLPSCCRASRCPKEQTWGEEKELPASFLLKRVRRRFQECAAEVE